MATGDKSHWVQILTETNTGGAVQRARQRTKNQPLNAEPAGAENDALVQQVAHSTNASPGYSWSQKTPGVIGRTETGCGPAIIAKGEGFGIGR